jgi:hypothetical protein
MNNDAYTYWIKVGGIIRYVGKGRGNRCFRHEQIARSLNEGKKVRATPFQKRLAQAMSERQSICVEIFAFGLTDAEAFEREQIEIAIRRADLWNILEGGEGMTSTEAHAVWLDPAKRKKRAASARARYTENPEYRDGVSNRLRAQALDAARARWGNAQNRQEMSKRMLAVWADPEYREKHIAAARIRCSDPKVREALTARSRAYRART